MRTGRPQLWEPHPIVRLGWARGAALVPMLLSLAPGLAAQPAPTEAFQPLPVGAVTPGGWIKTQLTTDATTGMAGHFLELRPQYGSVSWTSKDGDPGAGEMGGNWLDGFVRMAYLADHAEGKAKVDAFVRDVLAARDADGYLGNMPRDRRFNHRVYGDLWSESRLFVALLAYYEVTGNEEVLDAVIRAVDLDMARYGPENRPFHFRPDATAEQRRAGMQTHGLMFVDVCEWLYRHSGDRKYLDFAFFLYDDYNRADDAQRDTQLRSLLDMKYPYFGHGVQVAEHIRVPLFLAYADGRAPYPQAARNALDKLLPHIVPSGALASDESVYNHQPLANQAYEYCTTTELCVSLASALQKTGVMRYGDMIERAVFNAAQGARLPDGSCIAYLSQTSLPAAREDHDLPYSGTKRHKYSPAHDVGGSCCSANAVKIMPYYVCSMWMRTEGGLAALLFGPSQVTTTVNGVAVTIIETTDYPFSDTITFRVSAAEPVTFPLTIRIPGWSSGATITAEGATVTGEDETRLITKSWSEDTVTVVLDNPITTIPLPSGEVAMARGALVYAWWWNWSQVTLSTQTFSLPPFHEYEFVPVTAYERPMVWVAMNAPDCGFRFEQNPAGSLTEPWRNAPVLLVGSVRTPSGETGHRMPMTLIPLGCTVLRFACFPVWPFDDAYFAPMDN